MVVCMALQSCLQDIDLNLKGQQEAEAILVAAGERTVTRSTRPLSTAIKDFKLFGVKQLSAGDYATVFNNYVLWHDDNSAGTTQSNSNDWEYVGMMPTVGNYSNALSQTTRPQEIKYWDHSAQQYVFWAAGRADKLMSGFSGTDPYTTKITNLKEADLSNPTTQIYISEPKVVNRWEYRQPVQLTFQRFVSRIRIGFYETIPGYAVKDVRFYVPGSSTGTPDCTLGGQYVKDGASLDITCYLSPSPTVSSSYAAGTDHTPTHTFGTLNYTTADDNLLRDPDDRSFLGRMSSAATYAGTGDGYYTNILPNPTNNQPLELMVDYTLLSNDGTGQTIEVKHATATVPANFCMWKPNFSYTYLFKISDNTNGSPGGDVVGLYPITFTAFAEIPGTDNNQVGTITTFGEWSISTHQNNDILNDGIVYYKGKMTEVAVIQDNTSDAKDPKDVKVELDGTNDYVIIYHQATNNEWEVETTESASTEPVEGVYKETVDKYEEGIAYFKPDKPGTYRIEYWHKEGSAPAEKRSIKIIKVEDKVGFNVHYELNGHGHYFSPGSPILDTESVTDLPNPLPTPVDDNPVWTFEGWFTDIELTQPATPGTPLTDDITLYAKWHTVYTGQDLDDTDIDE